MPDWIKIILPLFSGGAAGAIITAIVAHVRNRIPKIDYHFTSEPIFHGTTSIGSYELRLVFANIANSEGNDIHVYKNVHSLRVQLTNSSSTSFAVFKFGIDLPKNMQPFLVTTSPQNRMHSLECLTPIPIDSTNDLEEIDFEIRPFNRSSSAEVVIFYTERGRITETPKILSSEAVRFVDTVSIIENAKNNWTDTLLKSAIR